MDAQKYRKQIVGAGLVMLMFLTGAAIKDHSIFGPSVAAWIQALGAIIALVVALYIPLRSEWQQAREKEVALRERRAVAREQVTVVSDVVLNEHQFAAGQIKTGVELLQTIDFKDLDRASAVALSELIMVLGAAEAVIAEATRENTAMSGLGAGWLRRIENARDAAAEAFDALLAR